MSSSTDVIEKHVVLRAPLDRVWRAISDADEFGAWFECKLTSPFVVGETVRGEITTPGHAGMPMTMHVEAIEPPRRFAFRWPAYDNEAKQELTDAPMTLVELILAEVPEGTRLTLRESGFDALPEKHRAAAFRGNSEGWTIQGENVRRHVER